MEAARACAERGHDVVLFEASNRLGGQVLLAGKPRWRRDLLGIIDWLEQECAHLGVDVRLNSFADDRMVRAESPDVVFIATGGLPHTDWVEGNASLLSSWDVLSGMASLDGDVLVHDQTGRNVALATADHLSEHGAAVTLNTQDAAIGMEAMRLEISPFMKRFYERGVVMQTDHEIISAQAQDNKIKVTFRNMHTARLTTRAFDHVVVEAGTLPNDELFYALSDVSINNGIIDLDAMRDGRPQPVFDEDCEAIDNILGRDVGLWPAMPSARVYRSSRSHVCDIDDGLFDLPCDLTNSTVIDQLLELRCFMA